MWIFLLFQLCYSWTLWTLLLMWWNALWTLRLHLTCKCFNYCLDISLFGLCVCAHSREGCPPPRMRKWGCIDILWIIKSPHVCACTRLSYMVSYFVSQYTEGVICYCVPKDSIGRRWRACSSPPQSFRSLNISHSFSDSFIFPPEDS